MLFVLSRLPWHKRLLAITGRMKLAELFSPARYLCGRWPPRINWSAVFERHKGESCRVKSSPILPKLLLPRLPRWRAVLQKWQPGPGRSCWTRWHRRCSTRRTRLHDACALNLRAKAQEILEKIGGDIKNHPLRKAYEAEVAGLKKQAQAMVQNGAPDEAIAKAMWQQRRDIGVKFKDLTPGPLRDYIYDVNQSRYGDKLGPSFESLVESGRKKGIDPFKKIIESSTRPNGDVNLLLAQFGTWLNKKDAAYLDTAKL